MLGRSFLFTLKTPKTPKTLKLPKTPKTLHWTLTRGLLVAGALLLALPRHAALVPDPSYYTEFTVSAPVSASLLSDLYAFVAELCAAVPGLPCAARNITAA